MAPPLLPPPPRPPLHVRRARHIIIITIIVMLYGPTAVVFFPCGGHRRQRLWSPIQHPANDNTCYVSVIVPRAILYSVLDVYLCTILLYECVFSVIKTHIYKQIFSWNMKIYFKKKKVKMDPSHIPTTFVNTDLVANIIFYDIFQCLLWLLNQTT